MKTRKEIEAKLVKVESDERLGYPVAMVQINALLAIIQIGLKAEARALRWVLGLPPGTYHGNEPT